MGEYARRAHLSVSHEWLGAVAYIVTVKDQMNADPVDTHVGTTRPQQK